MEFFNETCVLICSILVIELADPNNSSSKRNQLGWALIITACTNIGINFVVVARNVYKSLELSAIEAYFSFDAWLNRYKIESTETYTDETKQEKTQEFKDLEYCSDWGDQRRWLHDNGVSYEHFKEEIKFQQLLDKYNYIEAASTI